MATRTPEFVGVEDRLSLTVDSLNSIHLDEIPIVFEGLIRRVKLGVLFSRIWHSSLRSTLHQAGIEVTLDGKFSDEARQMGNVIMGFEEDGYNYVTVNAAASTDSLIVAARAATTSGILVAIPPGQHEALPHYLDKLEEANDQLEDGNKLHYLMADANDVAVIMERGKYVLAATGLYIPGLPEPPDVENRMTPAEVMDVGAASVNIGTALVCLPHIEMKHGAELALENIATVL
jgi:hypothetical protein